MSAYYDLYETPSPDGIEDKNHSMHVSVPKRLIPKRNRGTYIRISTSAEKYGRGSIGRLH